MAQAKVKKHRMEKRVILEGIQRVLADATGVKLSLDKADEVFKKSYQAIVSLIESQGPFSITGYGTFYSIVSKSGKRYIRYKNLIREGTVAAETKSVETTPLKANVM